MCIAKQCFVTVNMTVRFSFLPSPSLSRGRPRQDPPTTIQLWSNARGAKQPSHCLLSSASSTFSALLLGPPLAPLYADVGRSLGQTTSPPSFLSFLWRPPSSIEREKRGRNGHRSGRWDCGSCLRDHRRSTRVAERPKDPKGRNQEEKSHFGHLFPEGAHSCEDGGGREKGLSLREVRRYLGPHLLSVCLPDPRYLHLTCQSQFLLFQAKLLRKKRRGRTDGRWRLFHLPLLPPSILHSFIAMREEGTSPVPPLPRLLDYFFMHCLPSLPPAVLASFFFLGMPTGPFGEDEDDACQYFPMDLLS